jgi:hypothetical protein
MKLKDYMYRFTNPIDDEKRAWTPQECASLLGISVSLMYKIFREDHNIGIVTARKIQKATKNEVEVIDLIPDNWDQ